MSGDPFGDELPSLFSEALARAGRAGRGAGAVWAASSLYRDSIAAAIEQQQHEARMAYAPPTDPLGELTRTIARWRALKPEILLERCAPHDRIIVIEAGEFSEKRTLLLHPDTARRIWREAPVEAGWLGIPLAGFCDLNRQIERRRIPPSPLGDAYRQRQLARRRRTRRRGGR